MYEMAMDLEDGAVVMLSPGTGNTGSTTLCSTSLERSSANTGLKFFPLSLCLALPCTSPAGCQDMLVALLLGLTECLPSFQGADPPGPGGAAEGAARRGHVHARRI